MPSMRFSFRNLIVGSILLLLFSSAFADPANAPPSDLFSVSFLAKMIDGVLGQNLISMFISGGLQISKNFMLGAKVIAGTIALASMAWNLMMAQVNHESPTTVIIEGLIYAMITAVLLSMYSQIINSVADFGTWVTSTIGGSLGSSVSGLFGSIINATISSLQKIGLTAPTGTGFFGISLSYVVDGIVSAGLLIFALLLIVMAIIELVSVVILGPVIVGISIAFGPLFIASIASHWTRKWFDHWWNFLLAGALLYGMTVAVVQLVSNAISAAVNSQAIGGGTMLAGNALAIAVICKALGEIFAQIPKMADGLFPGRHGLSPAKGSGALPPVGAMTKSAATMTAGTARAGSEIGVGLATASNPVAAAASAISSIRKP